MSQNYEIIDRSYNKDTGELTQFLVLFDGEPTIRKATAENVLLFDPEDELPFENGMYEFLNGQKALRLSDEPEVMVAPTNNEYAYILRVDGNTVETTPDQSGRVLEGIKDAAIDGDTSGLVDVYDRIMREQVRRDVIDALMSTFEQSDERIEKISRGWLIDEFYLVDWAASLWTIDDDPDEADYQRSGSKAVEMDRSYEFVELNVRRSVDPVEVTINGVSKRLTEREMLFLSKVKWLLNRRHYHNDAPFWKYVDKDAAVDAKTGEPETSENEDDEPNLDKFSL